MVLGRKIDRKPHRKDGECSRGMVQKDGHGRAGRLEKVVHLLPMLNVG